MLAFFEWIDTTSFGLMLKDSVFAAYVLEIVHLLGLTLLLGAIFVMSFRLFGILMKDRPVSMVAAELSTWTLVGIGIMLTSGVLKAFTEPMKLYYNDPYWWKMYFLILALVFHFTIFRKVTRSDNASRLVHGVTGAMALILWFGVGIFGRAIGFF